MSRKKMWLGTQHHAQWVDCPLRGADMSPEGWGTEGTYLSGGGFVRQSQDSHRQYIFEWSGASSRESAEIMQAYRDGVYSKSRSDLIYFIDPLIYSRNILPKRWAQPGILAPDSGAASTPLGLVSKIDGPGVLGLPLTGAQVSGYFTSLAMFDATTTPQAGSIWLPVPPGETLHLVAWTEFFPTQESGLYVKAQNLDGSWMPAERVEDLGVEVSGARGVLLASVGLFNYFGARAVIGRGDGWADPAEYAWTGTPNESTSTRTTADGAVENLFTNPDMQATDGEVVVWENLFRDANFTGSSAPTGYSLTNATMASGVITLGASATNLITPATGGTFSTIELGTPLSASYVIENVGNIGVNLRIGFWDGVVYSYGPFIEIGPDETATVWGVSDPATSDSSFIQPRLHRASGGADEGAQLKIHGTLAMWGDALPTSLEFFTSTFSPDPDLTPQPRPGGGSQLVGQRVAGLTAANGVVVQSEQWSKSGGVSARLIYNGDSPTIGGDIPYAMILEPSTNSVAVWRYQDGPIGTDTEMIFTPQRVLLYDADGLHESEPAPNVQGEALLRAFSSSDDDGDGVVLVGGSNFGDSVWFDLLTVTDTEEYEGPPFSGSTPPEGPKWLPGLGHSGCAFVGNPTWVANSGVNGGQVGYAATLKEVGDWQQ